MGKAKINPEKWYSLTDLMKLRAFPWIGKGMRQYRQFVDGDQNDKNILKPVSIGNGKGKRYSFKGSNVLSLIAKIESGS